MTGRASGQPKNSAVQLLCKQHDSSAKRACVAACMPLLHYRRGMLESMHIMIIAGDIAIHFAGAMARAMCTSYATHMMTRAG
jgi:hypothetical protein